MSSASEILPGRYHDTIVRTSEAVANGLYLIEVGYGARPKVFYPHLMRPGKPAGATLAGFNYCGWTRKGTGWLANGRFHISYNPPRALNVDFVGVIVPTLEDVRQFFRNMAACYG